MLLKYNSLGSPPALLEVLTSKFSEPSPVKYQSLGIDDELNDSLTMNALSCAKIVTDSNNAIIKNKCFFMKKST